ncbi:MFS transporter [Kitasatospora sp. NBC_01266]|uniref:MFS transporter n=1 Tax=Kitasatospora sp. NBC_01266 TaxID=2903572 RepID=UPI002E31DC2F|nr:MFS transporter [Kitasatospora sp. NBC_01266]
MTAAPLRAATAFGAIASGDTATGGRALRRTLAVLLLIVLFSGFQQSYFTSLFQALGDRYHVGVSALAWTVTGPALTAAIATPLLAALGDRHGHLRVLRATTAAVAAGAVLIALAPDYPLLMAGRMLQGCLAGFLPLMSGLVRRRHGIRHTHRAIAYLSAALMFGVLLGSACSSLLLRTAGIGAVLWTPAVGTAMGLGLLPWAGRGDGLERGDRFERGEAPERLGAAARVDWPGAALLAAALVPVALALHEGAAWGWGSSGTLGCLGAGVVLLAAWATVQLRSPAPLIDLRRLLRPRLLPVFAAGCVVHYVVLGGQVSYSTYLTLPAGLGLPAASVGLVLLPAFCGMTVLAACTSRLGRVVGYRNVMVLGAALVALGATGLLLRHAGAADFAVALALSGAGMGLISGAARILVVDGVRAEDTAAGSGLFELLVGLGAAVGSATNAAILTAQGGGHRAYLTAWTVSAGVAVSGLAATLLLPSSPTRAHLGARARRRPK